MGLSPDAWEKLNKADQEKQPWATQVISLMKETLMAEQQMQRDLTS